MAYKDILVFLDVLPDADQRLSVAIQLAKAHGARLIGVNACSDSARSGPWLARAADLSERFETQMRASGLAHAYHEPPRDSARLERYVHYADLIIAPEPEREARGLVLRGLPDNVLLHGGVPVLLLPPLWRQGPVGERVVIGWNASREATRAVHDAMPILQRAREVTVFAFDPSLAAARADAAPLLEHLRAHGVQAEAETWQDRGDMSAVEALFACLSVREADLIVAGAYGRSRMLEGFFGGASHELLHQPTMPMLMTH
jgi:nucleotide-binding universal stress UspA family protein